MGIEDPKFATELITEKGRIYKFDDLNCMQSYATENAEQVGQAQLYVPDFLTHELFPIEKRNPNHRWCYKKPYEW